MLTFGQINFEEKGNIPHIDFFLNSKEHRVSIQYINIKTKLLNQ